LQEYIRIRGARVHNLKDISLSLPHHQLTVITGVSGSGKSSRAFDTIYAVVIRADSPRRDTASATLDGLIAAFTTITL
jgi:excinuclease UvrABC ATPase subunit